MRFIRVLGRNGRGTVDHFGLHAGWISGGTLSKPSACGRLVCGSRDLIDFFTPARPFSFSTSHRQPRRACIAAFDILEDEPNSSEVWANTRLEAALDREGSIPASANANRPYVRSGAGACLLRRAV